MDLSARINSESADRFDDLGEDTKVKILAEAAPVLSTPAANVCMGVTVADPTAIVDAIGG